MLSLNVRLACQADIRGMTQLSYEKRRAYEKAQPQFWRYKKGAELSQSKWFQELLGQEGAILLVAESASSLLGFIIGQLVQAPEVYDSGLTLMIDDFCVEDASAWPSVGHALLAELTLRGKAEGAVQRVVVSGSHDEAKCQFLKQAGLSVASLWYAGAL